MMSNKKKTYFTKAKQREANKRAKSQISSLSTKKEYRNFAKELGYPREVYENIASPKAVKNILDISKKFQSRELGAVEYQKKFSKKITVQPSNKITKTEKKVYLKDKTKAEGLSQIETKRVRDKGIFEKVEDLINDNIINKLKRTPKTTTKVPVSKIKAKAKPTPKTAPTPISKISQKDKADAWKRITVLKGGKNTTTAGQKIPAMSSTEQLIHDEQMKLAEYYNSKYGLEYDDSEGYVYAHTILIVGLDPEDVEKHLRTKLERREVDDGYDVLKYPKF